MAESNSGYSFNFDDMPSGADSLDDIFSGLADSTTVITPSAEPTVEPVVVADQPFLKTATGTVYKSIDDAVTGIEHKDALIAQLRQEVLQAKGSDPLKRTPEQQVEQPKTYKQDPKKYFEDIKKAKDEDEILNVQGRYVNEMVAEQLAPYAPLIAGLARSQAVSQISSELPQFHTFLNSQEYKDTLDSFPLLKQSIEISESYPERSGDLSQLYKMAAMAAAGRSLPKGVSTVQQTVVQPRPTITPTPSPALPNGNPNPPTLQTSEGRKAIIQQQEARGVDNLRF